jgi:hypothetical protein
MKPRIWFQTLFFKEIDSGFGFGSEIQTKLQSSSVELRVEQGVSFWLTSSGTSLQLQELDLKPKLALN